MNKYKRTIWSKQKIIDEIQRIADQKIPLNSRYIQKYYISLYKAACYSKHFKKWSKAIMAAGFDYNKISLKQKWSKQKIIDQVRLIASRGEPINAAYIRHKYPCLHRAASVIRYFGGWKVALSKAGFNPDDICLHKTRTSKQILYEIKELYKEYGRLNSTFIKKMRPGLLVSIRSKPELRYWKIAVEKAGFNFYRVSNVSKWDKERVITEIYSLIKKGVPLTERSVEIHHKDLYQAIKKKALFGSWEDALLASGVNVQEIKEEERTEAAPFVDIASIRECTSVSPLADYFLEYLKYERFVKKKAYSSIQMKRKILNKAFDYFKRRKCLTIRDVTTKVLRSYFASCRHKGISLTTIDISYYTIKLFIDYCVYQRYLSVNPILKIGRPNIGKKHPDLLTQEECLKLFRYACSDYTSNGYVKLRNLLILGFFLITGLQCREIVSLEPENINFNKKIIVLDRKYDSKIIPLPISLLKILKRYMSCRSDQSSTKLITSAYCSKPFSANHLGTILKNIQMGANISKDISPQKLRFTFASLLLNSGCSIIYLQKLLSHKNYSHTINYMRFATDNIRRNLELACK